MTCPDTIYDKVLTHVLITNENQVLQTREDNVLQICENYVSQTREYDAFHSFFQCAPETRQYEENMTCPDTIYQLLTLVYVTNENDMTQASEFIQ